MSKDRDTPMVSVRNEYDEYTSLIASHDVNDE